MPGAGGGGGDDFATVALAPAGGGGGAEICTATGIANAALLPTPGAGGGGGGGVLLAADPRCKDARFTPSFDGRGGGGGAPPGGGGGGLRIAKTLPRMRPSWTLPRPLLIFATTERRVAASAACFPHFCNPHDVLRIAAIPWAWQRRMSTTVETEMPESVPIGVPWYTSGTWNGTDSLPHAAETRSRRQREPCQERERERERERDEEER